MRAARCVHGFGFGGPKLMCVVLCGCSRRWCCRSCYFRLIELGLVFPVRSHRATVSAVPPVVPTRRRAMSSYIVRRVPCPVPTPRKLVTPTPWSPAQHARYPRMAAQARVWADAPGYVQRPGPASRTRRSLAFSPAASVAASHVALSSPFAPSCRTGDEMNADRFDGLPRTRSPLDEIAAFRAERLGAARQGATRVLPRIRIQLGPCSVRVMMYSLCRCALSTPRRSTPHFRGLARYGTRHVKAGRRTSSKGPSSRTREAAFHLSERQMRQIDRRDSRAGLRRGAFASARPRSDRAVGPARPAAAPSCTLVVPRRLSGPFSAYLSAGLDPPPRAHAGLWFNIRRQHLVSSLRCPERR